MIGHGQIAPPSGSEVVVEPRKLGLELGDVPVPFSRGAFACVSAKITFLSISMIPLWGYPANGQYKI
jgi:hypothetical protein